jgi:pimeloyl-ACP methyl ester carboxylesterase
LLAKLGQFDYRADLARLKVPLLVIHGEMDNPPLGGSEEWAAGVPQGRLLMLEGVGHWPHYERPAETLGAIRIFLDGGWPSGSVAVEPAR